MSRLVNNGGVGDKEIRKAFKNKKSKPDDTYQTHDLDYRDGSSREKGRKSTKDGSLKRKYIDEPNCPWKQEISASQSLTSPSNAATNIEGKKRRRRGENIEAEKSQGKRTNKTPPSPPNGPMIERSQSRNISVAKHVGHHEVIVTRERVRETLRFYQALVRKLLREEEISKYYKNVNDHRSRRADLLASKILKEKGRWVNTGDKILGTVPGVEIGDEFHFRAELAIVGLHHPFQCGIDFVRRGDKLLATSIVTSWCYTNNMDDSDVLVYLGQGGNPTVGDKKVENQKLEGANLALKNSIDEGTPVRVIRGFKGPKGGTALSTRGKLVSTYTYDGLYLVERYWEEKSCYGANVFKFFLRRMPQQPQLAIKELTKSMKTRLGEGFYIDDISQGKEKTPIGAVNTIDDEELPPFIYKASMTYPSWYTPTPPPRGCNCTDNCADPMKCGCAVKNGKELPYNHNGAIVEAKPLVYECGPSCKCPPSCYNRVSQHGIKFQLEIFKTKSRGWGVRSLTSISSGSFICEYIGELLRDNEAEQRTSNDEYLFDIGHNYNDHVHWEGLSKSSTSKRKSAGTTEEVEFTVDAANYGNVGRFINHSCSPNLYAQNVLYDHDDKRIPHIMLFAAENIPPLQELTFHYNYKLDQVYDSNGNIKKKDCYCGSQECIGRMY